MGKMLKKCCMLALTGGMVFGFLGGGCLDFGGGLKLVGRGFTQGAGWSLGNGLTNEFVTRPITRQQEGINNFWAADATFHEGENHPNPHPAD
ncbi:MAG: hypothetical protein ACE5HE_11605 [Phycisphaerae bacterium]